MLNNMQARTSRSNLIQERSSTHQSTSMTEQSAENGMNTERQEDTFKNTREACRQSNDRNVITERASTETHEMMMIIDQKVREVVMTFQQLQKEAIQENRLVIEQLLEKNRQLIEENKQLAEGNKQLAEGNRQLTEGNKELAEGIKQLAEGNKQSAEGIRQLMVLVHRLLGNGASLTDGISFPSFGTDSGTASHLSPGGASHSISSSAPDALSNTSTHAASRDPNAPSLDKNIVTIQKLWDEWKNTGSESTKNIPVVELNRTLGSKWRSSAKDRTFYSRRKTIIDEIEKKIGDGMTAPEAIEHCQQELGSMEGSKSLNSYTLYLRKRNKEEP